MIETLFQVESSKNLQHLLLQQQKTEYQKSRDRELRKFEGLNEEDCYWTTNCLLLLLGLLWISNSIVRHDNDPALVVVV